MLEVLTAPQDITVETYDHLFNQHHHKYKTIIHFLDAIPDSHLHESLFYYIILNFEDQCIVDVFEYLTNTRRMSWNNADWKSYNLSPWYMLTVSIQQDLIDTTFWLIHTISRYNQVDMRGVVTDILTRKMFNPSSDLNLQLLWDCMEFTADVEYSLLLHIETHLGMLHFFTNKPNRELVMSLSNKYGVKMPSQLFHLTQTYLQAREMYKLKFELHTSLPSDVIEHALLKFVM